MDDRKWVKVGWWVGYMEHTVTVDAGRHVIMEKYRKMKSRQIFLLCRYITLHEQKLMSQYYLKLIVTSILNMFRYPLIPLIPLSSQPNSTRTFFYDHLNRTTKDQFIIKNEKKKVWAFNLMRIFNAIYVFRLPFMLPQRHSSVTMCYQKYDFQVHINDKSLWDVYNRAYGLRTRAVHH